MLFEPVRSAEPPSVSGTTALTTSSTSSDDLRVATFGRRLRLRLAEGRRAPPASFFGSSPATDPLELRLLARRQLRRPAPPRPPAPRRRARRSPRHAGTHLLGHLERRPRPAVDLADLGDLLRARAASRARPWCPAWSAPRSRYACGSRSSPATRSPSPRRSPGRCRRDRARRTRAPTSPTAANRAFWSVTSARITLPSIEMPLSSHKTISFDELLLAGEPDRLVADPLHQAAVAGDHPGVVVDDLAPEARREALLGDRHADRVGEPLAERPGRRLDALGVAVLGMPGGPRPELAEVLDLLDRHLRDSRSGRAAHRAASTRARPTARSGRGRASAGALGVELQVPLEQHGRDVGHAHRHARDAPSSPSAPRPSPAPGAPPPSSSGRGGAGGARRCPPGGSFPARRQPSPWAPRYGTDTSRPGGQGAFAAPAGRRSAPGRIEPRRASATTDCIVPGPLPKTGGPRIESAEMSQITELEAQLAEALDRLRVRPRRARGRRRAAARRTGAARADRRARGGEGRARRRARAAAGQARQGRRRARRPDRPAQAPDRGGLTCPSSSSRSAAASSRSPASPARSPRSSAPAASSTPRPSASATPAAPPRSACCCSPA